VKHSKKTATLILGILTAVVLIVSQLFCYQNSDVQKKETKTEEHSGKESSGDQSTFFIVAASQGLSSFQTHISQDVILLFEIFFQENEDHHWKPEVPLALGKYFQTLFNIIISPNAP